MVNDTPRPLQSRERDPVPLVQGVGEPQGRSGQVRKISPAPGSDSQTAQPALDNDINSIFILIIGNFTRLHDVIGPKTVLFIPTTARTSNLAITPKSRSHSVSSPQVFERWRTKLLLCKSQRQQPLRLLHSLHIASYFLYSVKD